MIPNRNIIITLDIEKMVGYNIMFSYKNILYTFTLGSCTIRELSISSIVIISSSFQATSFIFSGLLRAYF
jgi:hypothetical protein